ncbi:hypothetical protein AB0N73_12630 [Microbacterium sp. NPDC089189]|uniref:three-helix bundle dimerization domain-containing protein n=1 Tax=Microbacterium sp. NPDC089189 TaxID=3154972 RepID=UPI00341C036D
MTLSSMPATGDQDRPHVIDGWELTSYAGVVSRLQARYPAMRTSEIEAIVVREHDAFTGGRPIVVPVDVERGAEEILAWEAEGSAL